jgi:hypothetical protein
MNEKDGKNEEIAIPSDVKKYQKIYQQILSLIRRKKEQIMN